ncbi:hypothetical protein SAY87_004485 [Trapa incisa]|uniref:Phosphatidic acid phosphatase type 2/haloperoxidase domain-containing protein n=2 Tax=Trapa TaxID=22665 RepID=A0AAN7QW97_TRANT|nr:hypothetical protein SAY87_004485 [Trapa incisa]KAK4782284.1 hypothetical protein SAY86_016386 [Trapa natans]
MSEIGVRAHSPRTHAIKVMTVHRHDWLILLFLVTIEGALNAIEPFHRFIGKDMMTDLKFPLKSNTVPVWTVPLYSALLPMVVFLIYYIFRRDVYDFHHAVLGLLYSICLTGVLTDAIKVAVGRPRPNFFYRCFPDGNAVFDNITHDVVCHGDKKVVREGYKSFPSGHTSWSFAGMVFLSWYMSGKVRAFDQGGHVAKLCIIILPILVAALVGVSRVDDYWHHWQDVFTGAIIGTVISTSCYLQFFPFPNDPNGWAPHARYFRVLEERTRYHSSVRSSEAGTSSMVLEHGIGMEPSSPDLEAERYHE